jgi:hypothetical protein
MVTARYTWDLNTLRKGFAIHRKTQRATKLIPLLAIVFIGWAHTLASLPENGSAAYL